MRIVFILLPLFLFALNYKIDFVGLDNEAALKAMFDASDLVTLQERPPQSINALRYRASGDIPDLERVLRAYGYYDARITIDVKMENDIAKVTLHIHSGPQYLLSSYKVYQADECTSLLEIPKVGVMTPESLGITLNSPAHSVEIVNAELKLLTNLAKYGYPLATIERRKVVVDMQEKEVTAAACVNEGPLSKFGPLSIFGLKQVQMDYILRRISWEEGEIYSTLDVEKTQKRLLNSNLFSSVLITHDGKLDENGELPIKMRLDESKHKQISLGPFYATVDGPGGMFTWTHRNLRGMGETFTINGEYSQRYITGIFTYKKPDFIVMDLTYRLIGQIERQDIHSFNSLNYRGANFLDHHFSEYTYFSCGLQVEHFNVTDSGANGTYLLFDVPMIIKYTRTDDQMNPTRGYTLTYQPHFFQSLDFGNQQFFKQRLTTTFYLPLMEKNLTFAGRIQFGSIAGTKQENVPLPVLFLGGSEDDLRGYRYLTVSPLDSQRRPLGGRSAVFLSAETRFRIKDFGFVPFADFGTVTLNELPDLDTKWFKSVGIGLRYFTFFGPLRFDIGFPLDRRRGIDHSYRIYASIGQAY